MGLGNDGPHQWIMDGSGRWRCVNCVELRSNVAVPDGQYSCNNIRVAAENGILGNPGDCIRCDVPDGANQYDPYALDVLNEYRIIMICDDCYKEIGDDI